MNKKKILWIALLIIIILAIVIGIIIARPRNVSLSNTENFNKNTNTASDEVVSEISDSNTDTTPLLNPNVDYTKQYKKTELSDGILYSLDGTQAKSDIVIGTNFFDTTINDIYTNPESYSNKNIEIEGLYLEDLPFTFVGRYSTSNICPNCPPGYSYFEFALAGTIDTELKAEDSWIKIIGTLEKGNDETSNFEDYYYLKVLNLEIMNEKGETTVNN